MAKHGVRRITNRGRDRVIGKFASLKMQQIIQWESQIERDCCYWLEFDRDVIAYRSQPLIISYIFEDRKLRHTPDFEVMRHSLQTGQYQYLEVKPYKKTMEDEFKRKHIARAAHFHLHGHIYDLITDEHLRKDSYLDNIRLLYRYARLTSNPEILLKIKRALPNHSKHTLKVLQNHCVDFGAEMELAYLLLYNGSARFDMEKHLHINTEIEMTWYVGDDDL